MRRATDYMFVLKTSPISLDEGLRESMLRGVPVGLLLGVSLGVAGCVVAMGLTAAVFVLCGPVLADMVHTMREMHGRSGWAVPKDAGRPPRSMLVAAAFALCGACPVVGPAALLWMRFGGAARGSAGSCVSHSGAYRQAQSLLGVYLCYPDRRFQLVGGWFGMWAPDRALKSRWARGSWLFVPLWAAVGVWCAALIGFHRGLLWPVPPWMGLLSALVCLGLAPAALTGAMSRAAADVELGRQPTFECGPTDWDRCAELVRLSTYEEGGVRLADHVFAGFLQPPHLDAPHPYHSAPADMLPYARPLLLHKSVTQGHGHVTGKTQSGKTAITMCGLLAQTVRGERVDAVDVQGNVVYGVDGQPLRADGPPTPIVIIDMKGDLAMYNTARLECERRGQPFRSFTLEPGRYSDYFNAVEEFDANGRPTVEMTELTVNALSLYWGAAYGRAYFSAQHRDLLLDACQTQPRPRTWGELYRRLLDTLDHDKHRDVFELISKVRVLAEYPQLGRPPAGVNPIRMREVLAEGQCVYFWLPASVSAMSVRDVGKLALFALLTEARAAANAGQRRRVDVFVDELQCLTGDNLAIVFQQSASTGVSMKLANQSISDLDADSSHRLSQVVRDNVSWRNFFSMHDVQEMARWISLSEERCSYLSSYSTSCSSNSNGTSSSTAGTSLHPVVHSSLNINTLTQVNNEVAASLIHVDCDAGGVRLGGFPRRVLTPWPLTASEYARRNSTPWPAAAVPTHAPTNRPVNAERHSRVEAAALSEFAALDELFGRLRSKRRRLPKGVTE